MKTTKYVSTSAIIVLLAFLGACTPFQLTSTPKATPIPGNEAKTPTISIPTASPTSAKVHQPPTPAPTIEPSEESYLVTLLHSSDCELPCYLGITPGKTSWADAQAILDKIGADPDPLGAYQLNGLSEYGFSLLIGDPTMINVTRTPDMTLGDMEIYQGLDFLVGSGKVQRIVSGVQTVQFPAKFEEYWSKYSLESIFKEFGSPDLVFLSIQKRSGGYLQSTVYSKLGIVIDTNGSKNGNMICPVLPQDSNHRGVDVGFRLTNLDFPLDLYGSGIPPTDRTLYLPIQESLGLTPEQYYQKVLGNPTVCFEIKEMLP